MTRHLLNSRPPAYDRLILIPALLLAMQLPVNASAMQQGNHELDTTKVDPSSLMPPPRAVPLSLLRTGVASVVAAPGEAYSAGGLHRFLFGDLNRDIWRIPFSVPVLRLDKVGGGLTVSELSGGKQTLGLHFIGEDGLHYQFRSMVKEPRRVLPKLLHKTPPGTVSKDQMAAQFPLAPMIVAELVEAVDVLVAKPRVVIMPDDERLGEYRDAFSGRMGWIESRPQEREGDLPGFAGSTKITGTEALYEELRENPSSYVNAPALLRARLIDFLVGDWDRHSDQWRWARFKDGERMRWDPIPRDRDWAFCRIDGVLRPFISFYYPQYEGFAGEYPNVERLAFASMRVDRTLLVSLDRNEFMKIANQVATTLSDSVLQQSVAVLPPQYRYVGDTLYNAMRIRRDSLVRAAREYYDLLAKEPGIVATDKADSVTITAIGDSVRLQLHDAGTAGRLMYDRTFAAGETKELRLYLLDGDDRVVVNGSTRLPLIVRVSTGSEDDRVIDRTSGQNLYVYNTGGDDKTELGESGFLTNSEYLAQDSIRTAARSWQVRDWGSAWKLFPSADHEPDIGILVGGKLTRSGFGYGQQSCHSCLSLETLVALGVNEWITNVEYDRMITAGGWWFANSLGMNSGRATRFHGFGNETPFTSSEIPFTGFRRVLDLQTGLRYEPEKSWNVFAGVWWRRFGEIREGGDLFNTIPYGGGRFHQLGVRTALEVDTRDLKALPTSGAVVRVSADLHPSWLDVESQYGTARGTFRFYQGLDLPLDPVLHLRVVGQKVWGTAPFADIPWVGGSSTLPGFARSQFRGDAMASGSALLRVKALSTRLITDLDVGVHGLTGIGRVWNEAEESSTWHRSNGLGLWLHAPAIGRTLSVTFAQGNKTRMYFDFGFIF